MSDIVIYNIVLYKQKWHYYFAKCINLQAGKIIYGIRSRVGIAAL